MNLVKELLKKWKWILLISVLGPIVFISITFAQDQGGGGGGGSDLRWIRYYTYLILDKIDKFPVYIESVKKMAESWNNNQDEKGTISSNQETFANLNASYNLNFETRKTFTKDATNFFLTMGGGASLPKIADQLSYTIFFKQSLLKPDTPIKDDDLPGYIQAYLKNLSASTWPMVPADPSWTSDFTTFQGQYIGLYNVLASVKSFDAYLLSDLLKQKDKNNKFADDYSKQLIDQASSSDWFENVRTESLGMVIRHLLMYTSQTYVQSSRMLKLQQQQIAAIAATNTVLITISQGLVGQALLAQAKVPSTSSTPPTTV